MSKERLTGLTLSDQNLVALPSAPATAAWLAVDAPTGSPELRRHSAATSPAPPKEFVTSDLDKAIEAAGSRPLHRLVLRSRSTAGARLLSKLAQPFGASSIALTVSVAGDVKGGGTMGLSIEGVKPSHPAKPLDVATTIANSLTSTDSFEASLTLEFETGLLLAGDRLKELAESRWRPSGELHVRRERWRAA